MYRHPRILGLRIYVGGLAMVGMIVGLAVIAFAGLPARGALVFSIAVALVAIVLVRDVAATLRHLPRTVSIDGNGLQARFYTGRGVKLNWRDISSVEEISRFPLERKLQGLRITAEDGRRHVDLTSALEGFDELREIIARETERGGAQASSSSSTADRAETG